MTTEDRQVKVTFTADRSDLENSLKKLNEQVKTLHSSLGDLNELTKGSKSQADSKFSTAAMYEKAQSALDELLAAEKDRLKFINDQNRALDKQLSKIKSIASSGGSGSGGAGSGAGGVAGPGGAASFISKKVVWAAVAKAITAVAGAAVSTVASQMRLGYGAYADYATSLAGMAGTGVSASTMWGRGQAGEKYGYSYKQTAEQARSIAIATGNAMDVTEAQMVSRATTLDMNQITSAMGTLTQAGNKRAFKDIIALGFESGIDKARLPEYMEGVQSIVKQQGTIQGGDIDTMKYAYALQAMGATGASGLQGARGAAVLNQLNKAILSPGGGEAGQALMLQSMGFGRPGGDTSYYEALRRQQEGASPDNIASLFSETRLQYGGGQEQILALSEMTGLGITVLEKLRGANMLTGQAREDKIEKILADSKPLEEQSLDEMKEVGFHAQRIAFLQNRLVGIGQGTYESVLKLQDLINKYVDAVLPIALKILDFVVKGPEKVAEVASDVATLAKDVYVPTSPSSPFGGLVGFNPIKGTGYSSNYDPKAYGMNFSDEEGKAVQRVMSRRPDLQAALTAALKTDDGRKDERDLYKRFNEGGDLHAEVLRELAKAASTIQNSQAIQEMRYNSNRATGTMIPEAIIRPVE